MIYNVRNRNCDDSFVINFINCLNSFTFDNLFSYLIKHVKESSCWGGHIKIEHEESILNVEEEKETLIKEYPKLLKSNPIFIKH